MSALAMILMTAMVVPGKGPEKVSMEMEQGLDLSEEWEGTIEARDQGIVGPIRIAHGKLYRAGSEAATYQCKVIGAPLHSRNSVNASLPGTACYPRIVSTAVGLPSAGPRHQSQV